MSARAQSRGDGIECVLPGGEEFGAWWKEEEWMGVGYRWGVDFGKCPGESGQGHRRMQL